MASVRPATLGPFRPVDASTGTQPAASTETGETQYLADFTSRYCARNARSKAHTRKFRPVYSDQRAIAFFQLPIKELCFPLVLDHAEGSRIRDIDGNTYIDIAMDFGISLFGHQPTFLKEAFRRQMDRGWAMSMRPAQSARAAALLCELTDMERAVFSQSGTEAVMSAVRLARQVTGRRNIVVFTGSYHGHSDGLLAFGMKENGAYVTKPFTNGTPREMVANVTVLPYGDPESLEIIDKRANELAAVVVEPVQSRNVRLQPREFLKDLRRITARGGAALIFDEMIVGFRIQPGGAQQWFDVRADMATYGKILGGGLSLGAIAGKARYLDAIDGGAWDYEDTSFPRTERTFFAGTHCQNTFATLAAQEILQHLKTEGPGLQERLNARSAEMCEEMNRVLTAEAVPLRVFYFGSLFRFEPEGRVSPFEQFLFLYHLRMNGIMVSEVGNNFLSTAHTEEDIADILNAMKTSIAQMKTAGFFKKNTPQKQRRRRPRTRIRPDRSN